MAITPEGIITALKQNKFAPVYFLQGEEPYYIDLISDYIEAHALQESEKGFNQVVMYGKDAEINKILTNARRYPMMADRQVVIVKEAQEIPDLNKEDGQKLLESYLNNPLPSTILVFSHKYKTLDGRKSLARTVKDKAILLTTKKLYDSAIPDWITNYVKTKGFGIDIKATQMLTDYIGNNLSSLTNEIDKILINFKEKTIIDAGIVQKFVGISKEYNVFELQKALGIRDVVKANQIVNYFEANPKNNPVIPIIALIFSFYSKLLLIHHSKDKSERGLASALSINPYFIREYLVAVRNYPIHRVIDNIHSIKLADLQSKGIDSPSMAEGQILRELIFKLMH